MMNKLSAYILALAIAGLGTACQKELLDPVPTTDIPDWEAFTLKERIANEATGLYTVMKNGKFLGGKVLIANDVRGEDFVNALTNNVTLNATWKMTATGESQEIKEIWSQGYMAINNANVFLAGMAAKGNAVAGDSLAKIYAGDAKFVRGLTYFSLLQLFARPYWDGAGSKPGLILFWEPHTKLGSYARARSTVKETYDQIIRDLDSAETLLPKSISAVKGNYYSAIALKMKVYLYMGQYDKVIAESAKIVTGTFTSTGGHKLEADLKNLYTPKYSGKEAVIYMPFGPAPGDAPGTQTQLGYYYSPSALGGGANGEYYLSTAGIIAEPTWKATDLRRQFILPVQINANTTRNYLIKYAGGSPFLDYAPVMRWAEVLLTLAEAKVRVSNTVDQGAIDLLNAVHGRSDATTVYTAANFTDAAALITTILKEKHIELLGEGNRAMEIIRQGIPFPKKSATIPEVPSSSPTYIWPLSSDEMVYNKLCVDNQ
ncbi:RagB/SusD family nutrient uptake outer membrane protein [Chitinophaga qingshengii]|uniref:RagB/SusD family nutrient uptake outer membrane protein n=1 Tax=Chitinophaga qingshengii TaxID=1569794 RepID=A0ABR7TL02_9BACT|nr:RagB/SusD family nutrient uptake outer membrane protein [Chitinophaga qingshengii]MBC9930633.1 RagB/SusD family nutrient uptake outer membrane protein [Chitinophaga qingshengii]